MFFFDVPVTVFVTYKSVMLLCCTQFKHSMLLSCYFGLCWKMTRQTQNQFPLISLSVIYYLCFKLSLFFSVFFASPTSSCMQCFYTAGIFWCEESLLELFSAIDCIFFNIIFYPTAVYQLPLFLGQILTNLNAVQTN